MPYLSKKTEDNLIQILLWSKREDINSLICKDKTTLDMFVTLETDLIKLQRIRKRDNEKTWSAIKERRKTDKNYCR